jgi:hypothetical protein
MGIETPLTVARSLGWRDRREKLGMRRDCLLVIMTLGILWGVSGCHYASAADRGLVWQVRERLRSRLEAVGIPLRLTVGAEPIYTAEMLRRLYEERVYRPIWSGDAGPLPHVDDLLKVIREADREGLRPADYYLAAIETLWTEVRQSQVVNTDAHADCRGQAISAYASVYRLHDVSGLESLVARATADCRAGQVALVSSLSHLAYTAAFPSVPGMRGWHPGN